MSYGLEMLGSDEPQRRGVPIRSISAVLPAHNEGQNIRFVVEATLEALNDAVPDFEVIIVDDGSRDTTPRLADELAIEYPQVKVIHHPKNRGYGAAWRSGIAAASKQYTFFMDADRQFDPAELVGLVQWGDAYDIVAGHRLRRNDPLYRFLIGSCFNILVRLLFRVKLRDVDCGFKLFRTSLLQRMSLESPGALINTEIHYRANQQQATLREVGIHHYPRRVGKQSGTSLRVILRAVREIIALRRRITRERKTLKETQRTTASSQAENPSQDDTPTGEA